MDSSLGILEREKTFAIDENPSPDGNKRSHDKVGRKNSSIGDLQDHLM
jgi:hypothetical protein